MISDAIYEREKAGEKRAKGQMIRREQSNKHLND